MPPKQHRQKKSKNLNKSINMHIRNDNSSSLASRLQENREKIWEKKQVPKKSKLKKMK